MWVAGPWGKDDGVLGLGFDVALFGVDDDYFREVAVEVGKVLLLVSGDFVVGGRRGSVP